MERHPFDACVPDHASLNWDAGLHGSLAEVQSGRREVRAHVLRSPALPPPAARAAPERSYKRVKGNSSAAPSLARRATAGTASSRTC